ncbi:MAG TPA: HEAT repeat domain-containing protein [Spirochaetia bacterium]|nr:HEAT repeat domain-containing protein [Spirochaetia bacterium]
MREADRASMAAKTGGMQASPRSILSGAFAIVLFLAPAFLLGAQSATQSGGQTGTQSTSQASSQTGSGEITIEELFLKSIEFQIIREKAVAADRELKLSALDDLQKRIDAGLNGSDAAQVEFILEYLALEGSGRIARENGHVVNDFPEVRRRAANLLGQVGTESARNALVRVLLIDDEPIVKAEAAYALGNLGMNPNNEVVRAIEFAYNMEDSQAPDQNFGYAISLAIEKLAQKTPGGLRDPEAYKLLVRIAQGNYLRTVKAKALQVLDELQGSK